MAQTRVRTVSNKEVVENREFRRGVKHVIIGAPFVDDLPRAEQYNYECGRLVATAWKSMGGDPRIFLRFGPKANAALKTVQSYVWWSA